MGGTPSPTQRACAMYLLSAADLKCSMTVVGWCRLNNNPISEIIHNNPLEGIMPKDPASLLLPDWGAAKYVRITDKWSVQVRQAKAGP